MMDDDPDLIPPEQGVQKRRRLNQPDDLPFSIREKMIGKPSEQKEVHSQAAGLGQSQLPLLGMACAVNNWGKTDAWLKPNGKDQLSKLLGVKVLAARAHAASRIKCSRTLYQSKRLED